MFLTGQLFARPWDEPQAKPHQIKDKKFYNTQGNLWNNAHRSSKKVAKYYHEPDNIFKQTHYSDKELMAMQNKQILHQTQQYHTKARQQSQDRLKSRKFEREILQFKSNQPVAGNQFEEIGEMAMNEPMAFNKLSLKRSNTLNDPEKSKQPNMQLWSLINQFPSQQISKIVRPNILQMDQNACNIIKKKIDDEKQCEEWQKEWHLQNRDEIRVKFLERHEQNIKLEKKSGVKKEYLSVREHLQGNQIVTDPYGRQIQNKEQPQQITYVKANQRPVSAYIMPTKINFSRPQSTKTAVEAPLSELNLGSLDEVSEEQATITFRQKNNHTASVNQLDAAANNNSEERQIVSGGDEQMLYNYEEQQQQQQQYEQAAVNQYGQQQQQQLQNNTVAASRPQTSHHVVQSQNVPLDFKVTTATKPMFYKSNQAINRLKQPKQKYESDNPYIQADFRGLLNADFREALQKAHIYSNNSNYGNNSSKTAVQTPMKATYDIQEPFAESKQSTNRAQTANSIERRLQYARAPSDLIISKNVSRPMTAYKASQQNKQIEQESSSHYRSNNHQFASGPLDVTGLLHNKSGGSSRQKCYSQKNTDFTSEQQQDENNLHQLDWFEQVNLCFKKGNKYPRTQYEEALNFEKRFKEHLLAKKTTTEREPTNTKLAVGDKVGALNQNSSQNIYIPQNNLK